MLLGERIILVSGVMVAVGLIWKYVWGGFLRPVRDAAVAVRDTVTAFPEQAERIEAVVESQVSLRESVGASQENQTVIQKRQEMILGRLEDGDEQFEQITYKLDRIVSQVSNGDDSKTIPDRIEECNETIERHSRDDLANFRALGAWSKQFRDFVPFEPVAGIEDGRSSF